VQFSHIAVNKSLLKYVGSDILQASDNLQLDEVPADLAADDGVDQAIINGTLDEAAHNNRDKRKYLDLPLNELI